LCPLSGCAKNSENIAVMLNGVIHRFADQFASEGKDK
jgi:hypothetical protein